MCTLCLQAAPLSSAPGHICNFVWSTNLIWALCARTSHNEFCIMVSCKGDGVRPSSPAVCSEGQGSHARHNIKNTEASPWVSFRNSASVWPAVNCSGISQSSYRGLVYVCANLGSLCWRSAQCIWLYINELTVPHPVTIIRSVTPTLPSGRNANYSSPVSGFISLWRWPCLSPFPASFLHRNLFFLWHRRVELFAWNILCCGIYMTSTWFYGFYRLVSVFLICLSVRLKGICTQPKTFPWKTCISQPKRLPLPPAVIILDQEKGLSDQ